MPLKQLVPLTKEVDIGDVSSLNEVEGRRILKAVLSEVNARSKAAIPNVALEPMVDQILILFSLISIKLLLFF